jgi:hypothetical protein
LKAVREVWDDHVACMKKLRDVLKYMVCLLLLSFERNRSTHYYPCSHRIKFIRLPLEMDMIQCRRSGT